MANTFFPTQIGTTYTGSSLGSQIIIGKDVDSTFEAAGFGQNGRPDPLQNFIINITNPNNGEPDKVASISIDLSSILYYINNRNAPATGIQFAMRELSVCDVDDNGNATEKSILALCSQTFIPPSGT